MPSLGFVIGAVAAWIIASLVAGGLLPAFSWQTILAVVIGGIVGTVVASGLESTGKEPADRPDRKS